MIEIVLTTVQDCDDAIKEIEKERRLIGTKDHKKQVFIMKGIDAYKSDKQNRTFHKLLELFWDSAYSSYLCYDSMRRKFKEIAGLVKIEYRNNFISDEGKLMIWNAIKGLALSKDDRKGAIELLRGRIEKEGSWADATQKKATRTIKMILEEMDESGVIGSKVGKEYGEVLEKLESNNY